MTYLVQKFIDLHNIKYIQHRYILKSKNAAIKFECALIDTFLESIISKKSLALTCVCEFQPRGCLGNLLNLIHSEGLFPYGVFPFMEIASCK